MMSNVKEKIGYIGIGHMGGGIAQNIAKKGVDLTVYDRNPEAVSKLVGNGAKAAGSLKKLVENVDIIIICVVNDEQVESVCHGPEGVVAYGRKGQVIVIQSTVKPATTKAVGEAAAAKGIGVIDAPVSGVEEEKLEGRLRVFVGGEEEYIKRCRPILNVIGGDSVVVVGSLGDGQIAKLINNTMNFHNMIGAREACKVARACGISESKLRELVRSGDSWSLQNMDFNDGIMRVHEMGRNCYTIALKDMRDAKAVAKDVGVETPVWDSLMEYMPTSYNERADYLGIK